MSFVKVTSPGTAGPDAISRDRPVNPAVAAISTPAMTTIFQPRCPDNMACSTRTQSFRVPSVDGVLSTTFRSIEYATAAKPAAAPIAIMIFVRFDNPLAVSSPGACCCVCVARTGLGAVRARFCAARINDSTSVPCAQVGAARPTSRR